MRLLIEASMALFDHSEHWQDRLRRTTEGQPLPVGQSIVVIAGLSVLSWAVLISVIFMICALA
jgi:hypothetical protein